jgi:hypothetical protein
MAEKRGAAKGAKKERVIPGPVPRPGTEAYWEGAKSGKLMIKKCSSCGKVHHYPRALCPYCFSEKLAWTEAKGTGSIYSYSVMRRTPEPYCIAYVTLDEGVSMMTNIVDCDFDKVRIGQKVKVVFKPSDGGPPVPCWTPA